MSQEDNGNWENIGKALSKAGIATVPDIKQMLNEAIGKTPNGNRRIELEDLQFHIEKKCGNNDCPIATEIEKMLEGTFKRGVMSGVKMGQIAAKKGLKL